MKRDYKKGRVQMLAHITDTTIITLVVAGFLSAFIDATVGGGGLISLPALLFVGLPPALALGTNKMAGTMSAVTSTLSYLRSGKVAFRLVGPLFPLGAVGAAIGAIVVHHLPSAFLRPLVLVLLIMVAGYTLWNKRLGISYGDVELNRRVYLISGIAALVIGFYDGFFGPGTGSFLMMVFVLLGFDFVTGSGNARTINFASNLGALATFVIVHSVVYVDGLILGLSMVVGALAGSQFAIRKGARYVRPIFIGVTFFVIVQQVYTLVK